MEYILKPVKRQNEEEKNCRGLKKRLPIQEFVLLITNHMELSRNSSHELCKQRILRSREGL